MANAPPKLSKGQLTAERILDAAEDLFARQGYEGTTLRQIAGAAAIQEPGLYNHFSGKLALYEAVLHRALNPMTEALGAHLNQASGLRDYTNLPSLMTDLLLDHPQIAALFQQAMQGDSDSAGNQLMRNWLNRLFNEGFLSLGGLGSHSENDPDQAALAINVIAMFNLTTGYFLSQRAFDTMAEGDLQSPENIARQKRLLHRVMRAMLIS
ncbi:MAG: TetR/AcrR family transcriptional regulator [Proteobacteria bacterium]|nr:TetR/AcrR family transcriptional regulator [Pseudomonadota bacterium]